MPFVFVKGGGTPIIVPLPLGHMAIGLAICDLGSKNNAILNLWKLWKPIVFILVLSNLPDIDMVIGLIVQGNGDVFHRGLTHSLIFALVAGLFASNAWRVWSQIPRLHFIYCFLIVLSHVLADVIFTGSPVSFFWPLDDNVSNGYRGWEDVTASIFLQAFQDAGIIMGCGVIIGVNRVLRSRIISLKFHSLRRK